MIVVRIENHHQMAVVGDNQTLVEKALGLTSLAMEEGSGGTKMASSVLGELNFDCLMR